MSEKLNVNNLANGLGWEILLYPPISLKESMPDELSNSLYIKEASIPSVTSEMIENRIHDKVIKIIKGEITTDSITLSIRGDIGYKIYTFFKAWNKLKNVTVDGIKLLRYPDDYYGKIKISLIENGNFIFSTILRDVYPMVIPDLRLLSEASLVNFDIPIIFNNDVE
jgi:hypothetical protein